MAAQPCAPSTVILTPPKRPDGFKPIHYEFSHRRAHCGVRLSLKTLATKAPEQVNCPKCWPAARKDLEAAARRSKPEVQS